MLTFLPSHLFGGFLGGTVVKNPLASVGDTGDASSIPKILRRKWQPTPVFLPGKSHGQRSLVDHSPRGCKESDTTEQLILWHYGGIRQDSFIPISQMWKWGPDQQNDRWVLAQSLLVFSFPDFFPSLPSLPWFPPMVSQPSSPLHPQSLSGFFLFHSSCFCNSEEGVLRSWYLQEIFWPKF